MADLRDYLDRIALDVAISRDNTLKINQLRNQIGFEFLKNNRLQWNPLSSIYATITNASNNPVAATVTDFDVESKIHKRGSLSELTLQKFPISNKRVLSERELMELKVAFDNSNDIESLIVNKMFDDVSATKFSIYERIEYMYLQLLSTGKLTLDGTSNNGGLIKTIDYNLSSDYEYSASTAWATSASATPIDDIKDVVTDMNTNGLFPTTIFMTQSQLDLLTSTDEYADYKVTTVAEGATALISGLPQINTILRSIGLPTITLITDAVFGYNSSGVRTALSAWDTDNVVFGFDSNHGTIDTATPPTDLMRGASNLIYAVDENEGIMTTVSSEIDPPKVETQSRTYGLVNLPAIYNFGYLDIT